MLPGAMKRVCILSTLVCDGHQDSGRHLTGNLVAGRLGDPGATFHSVDVFLAPVHLAQGHWVR